MAWIDVDKIEVHKEQSWEPGGDELYLTVNGINATPTTPSLGTGGVHNFPYKPIWFSDKATVNLWEEDDWPNDDDHIATVTFYKSDAPDNDVLRYMDGDGGQYDVYFDLWV
jgi:hypothetical protein